LSVQFIVMQGESRHVLSGQAGDSVMQVSRAAGLPVLGECNVSDDEEAMLDTVFSLSPTSRLSCQIRLSADLDGLRLSLP